MCNGSAVTPGEPRIVDNSGRGILPVGIESFADVARRFVYVDKTLVLRDLVDRGGVTLFCRPRRFGKSTMLRMVRSFFELPVEGHIEDQRELFANLAIWDAGAFYRAECAAHPAIFLSLGGCARGSYGATIERIAMEVAREYRRHRYLLENPTLTHLEREGFERMMAGQGSAADLEASVVHLAELLKVHHGGASVVILVDEYDNPITDGHLHGYRPQILDFYRSWLTDALKGTDSLYCAVLTGVLRVSQESIFSELNNVRVDTTLDEHYSEAFGFTGDEVAALAAHVGKSECLTEMCEWYDGYRFGGSDVYNPWSVISYLQTGVAQPYWTNTSNNSPLRDLITHADEDTTIALAALASGGTVERPLDLRTVFDDLGSSPRALWAQLYQAGYVTTDDTGAANDDERLRRLRVPNVEVRRLFGRELLDRSVSLAGTGERLNALH